MTPYDVSGERAIAHARYLAESIGMRLAGTEADRRGAEYIAEQLQQVGVSQVALERFPCLVWGYEQATLTVDGVQVPCLPVAHAGSTPPGGVEGELIYLENALDHDPVRVPLEGRIGLMCGLFGEDPKRFRKLMESGLAALLVVDDRLPFDWNVAVGLPGHWVRSNPLIPMVSVPFRHAWDLVRRGASQARLELHSWRRESESVNVVGFVPGTDPNAGEVLLTCHHDSVMGSPGGEDNGSGVGCLLELARVFARSSPRMGLRFVSCGAEEQLSEGAKHYALQHRQEIREKARFLVNSDSLGCWLGTNDVYVIGSPLLRSWVEEQLRTSHFVARVRAEVSPYSDHFPFAALGVPTIWFHRRNCAGGRFYHHSAHDTADVLSPKVMEATLRVQARILEVAMAGADFAAWKALSNEQKEAIARCERDLYGVTFQSD